MDFRTLNYVVAIAEHQNLTKAAEALYVGQPTLSKFLASLEDELGLKLFRRLGHRYQLTYAGERYVDRARRILQLGDDLDAEMSDILRRDVGILRVAFAPMRSSYVLPLVLPEFQRQHPHVKITVLEGNSETNDRRLLNGEADLAFYSKPSEINPLIEYTILAQEELLLCMGDRHPLCHLASVEPGSPYPHLDLDLLRDERVLLLTHSQRTRQITDAVLRENHVHLNNIMVMANMQAVMGLVAGGYGVSFLFDCHLRHRVDPRPLACCRFGSHETFCDLVAASRKGSYLPKYAQNFINIVKATV